MSARRLICNAAKSCLPGLLARTSVRRAALIDTPQFLSSTLASSPAPTPFRYTMAAPLAVPAGDSGAVHHVHSEDAWNNKLGLLAQENRKLAVVDFTAAWCGPCKMVAPVFKELSKKYPDVLFLKVDVDELPDVTSEWKVQAMPTFVFISGKNEVHRVVGADTKQLEAKIAELSK